MRPALELDIENLVDFFQVKLSNKGTGRIYNFPMWPGGPSFDIAGLVALLCESTIVTFNGINYDLPILVLALYGADNRQLKEAGDAIITGGLKWWDFYRSYNVEVPQYIDHVDIMEVASGVRISLKMYGGRCHAPKMQDIPVAFDKPILPHERLGISTYCDNDLETTYIMRVGLKDRLALREAIGQTYRIDVRSKSDAQIAEAVIKAKLDFQPAKRYIPHGFTFNYTPPPYIRFATKPLQDLHAIIVQSQFVVSDKEEALSLGFPEEGLRTGVQIPAELKGRDIRIGSTVYRMGIGGLHSQESSVYYIACDDYEIWDVDVASYYPTLIENMGMYPEQLGPAFLTIYSGIKTRRLEAKAEAHKLTDLGLLEDAKAAQTESDGLKIVLNGTFGKLFSKYSILYAPEFGIRTTVSGQLSLLMLIELLELSGIRCVSANTDGVVLLVPKGWQQLARDVVKWWESATGLTMEESHYKAIYSRDVNNYIAITDKGKVKRKGVFGPSGLIENKHPDKDICADAVVAFLQSGVPIETTIRECTDIRKFLQVRQVTGGGSYQAALKPLDGGGINFAASVPVYLGKAVRWYYGASKGRIVNAKGHMVAGSEDATPIMELPSTLPVDINYKHYIMVATDMLADLGVK